LPGLALASAINSLTEFAGTDCPTTRISGTEAICETGTKSFIASKLVLL
jgi:hypothetical protein